MEKNLRALDPSSDITAFRTSDPLLSVEYDRWHAKFTLLSATKTETPWCEGTFCFRIFFFETLNVIIGFSDPRSWQNPNYDGLGYRCGGRVGMYLESCLFRKVHVIAL